MEELQNLTPLYNKEFYLAYLCGEDVELPIPDGNTEHYLAYLCGMDVPIPDPLYTKEFYLAYKCGMDVELPEPGPYRIDQYLAKWCGMDVEVPEPTYRIEYWLAQLANSGELKTVSGNPISVSDALARPAESLVIEILPYQSGSGDPSPDNVRPISGFTGVNIPHTGKNLFDIELLSATNITVSDGVATGKAYNFYQAHKNGVSGLSVPNGQVTLSATAYTNASDGTTGNGLLFIFVYTDGTQTPALSFPNSTTSRTTKTVTSASGKTVDTIKVSYASLGSNTWYVDSVQLEVGATASDFEPYTGTTYAIDWTDEAGTVYGGSLDVVSGVLTAVPYYGSYNGETLVGPWVSSMDKYVAGTTPTIGAQVVDMGGTGTNIQLSATDVELLEGNNTIWNDVGDMTLEYLADGPAEDIDALQILLGNRYVNNGEPDEATDREALEILLGGNIR